MIIESNLKSNIKKELITAKSVWIASAMISNSGWSFLQKNIPNSATQFYLIGIDLSTDPKVFESILQNLEINARVYETKYTFHPKVYLIEKENGFFTAFIGSSNTTNWGLEKNVEMNFQIKDQNECRKLLNWFNALYASGYLITQIFLDDYKFKFIKTSIKKKEIVKEVTEINASLNKDKNQFFSKNHHEVFAPKYHRINSENLKRIRKEVSLKFKELHNIIYPQFLDYGITDLHCHHQSSEIVSRHYFNPFSGKIVNAIWLHYGKSHEQLRQYANGDKSTNRPDSFINNIRMQVIIHENSLGIWLVLGRSYGSKIDRDYFKNEMKNPSIQKRFYDAFKKLGNEYWIDVSEPTSILNIKTPSDLLQVIQKERLEEYFIIGRNINWLDNYLSSNNLSTTILDEFRKLYPLYELMRHK